jgi:hypothetical protein
MAIGVYALSFASSRLTPLYHSRCQYVLEVQNGVCQQSEAHDSISCSKLKVHYNITKKRTTVKRKEIGREPAGSVNGLTDSVSGRKLNLCRPTRM